MRGSPPLEFGIYMQKDPERVVTLSPGLEFSLCGFFSGFNIYLLEKRHMGWVVSLYYRSMMCPYLTVFLNKFQVKRAKKKATYETVSGMDPVMLISYWFTVFTFHGSHGYNPLLPEFANVYTVNQFTIRNGFTQCAFVQPPE